MAGVSIVIVNWNSCNELAVALSSVERTCKLDGIQAIVVDNGSFDGSAKLVATRFPWVEFLQLNENLGFGRANNIAFERVQAPMVLFLNPDAELRPGAVDLMVSRLQDLPRAGVIGPTILNPDGSFQHTCFRRLPMALNRALESDIFYRFRSTPVLDGQWRLPALSAAMEAECLSGACMLVRSEMFRAVKGFSPEFFMYGEDVDFCFKVRALGWRIYFVPEAVVIHSGGKSSAQQFSKFSAVGVRAAEHAVLKKWRGVASAALYRTLLALGATVRILCLTCLLPVCGGEGFRVRCRIGIQKWWAILRWCLGREKWADALFRPRGTPESDKHVPVRFPRAGATL